MFSNGKKSINIASLDIRKLILTNITKYKDDINGQNNVLFYTRRVKTKA